MDTFDLLDSLYIGYTHSFLILKKTKKLETSSKQISCCVILLDLWLENRGTKHQKVFAVENALKFPDKTKNKTMKKRLSKKERELEAKRKEVLALYEKKNDDFGLDDIDDLIDICLGDLDTINKVLDKIKKSSRERPISLSLFLGGI